MHTKESLQRDLRQLGLTGSETILVHSSMKSIGAVESRADGVLDALTDFFKLGVLIFPSFTYISIYGGEGHDRFDVKTSCACTGILPELFRRRPGVIRSLHPTHSLSALGKNAEELTAGHEKFDTIFNRQGPFGRLLDCGAKVLLIGVTLDRCTFIHALEEWAKVPVLSQKAIPLISVDHAGREIPVKLYWHKGAHSEVFDRILPRFLETGVVRSGRFGDAPTLLFDCQKAYDILVPLLKENPDFFHNPDCPPQPE